jgi:hypothetical protein
MIPGVSLIGGKVHALDRDGRLASGVGQAPDAFGWRTFYERDATGSPVLLVHGFGYDPRASSLDNPHGAERALATFPRWRRDLVPEGFQGVGFGWYSAPPGARHVLRSWRHGRWNRYRYAWDLAGAAGRTLASMIVGLDVPVNILCHSLGSRVVIEAFRNASGLPVSNVVFMNGAEFAAPAYHCARANRHVRFVNLVVKADDVLSKLDTLFAPVSDLGSPIGLTGLGIPEPNWIDIDLDDEESQARGARRGWHLQGDNPEQYADHWYTFRHPGNHGLIRAALAGEPLDEWKY